MMERFMSSRAKTLSLDDLLISIMLRYPEIGTIKFNPRQRVLHFTFIILESFDSQHLDNFTELLVKALDTYNHIEKRPPSKIHAEYTMEGGVTLIKVALDMESLYPDEITFVVEFFKEWFDTESREDIFEEEILFQEEIIRQSLEQSKRVKNGKCIIALRDDGQVIVYNK